jgi:hypothetical protein
VAVNSLGLLDLVQIAAKGLALKESYQVYLAESNQSPFGKLEPLAVLKTNPDGAGIVQAIGPLKTLAGNDRNSSAPQRFLVVTDLKDSSQVVLQQASPSSGPDEESRSVAVSSRRFDAAKDSTQVAGERDRHQREQRYCEISETRRDAFRAEARAHPA